MTGPDWLAYALDALLVSFVVVILATELPGRSRRK